MVRTACVVLCTALSAILSALAISYLIRTIAKYRTEDLVTATEVEDFELYGSCIGTLTSKQLTNANFDKEAPSCADSNTDGTQGNMMDALAGSVHALYYTYYTLSETAVPLPAVAATVFTATLSSTVTPASITVNEGYLALAAIAEKTVPTSCDTIYNMVGESSITDGDAVTYLALLRAGETDKDDWPLVDIPVVCNDQTQIAATGTPIDVTTALSASNTQKLYAHCLVQFQFASSGIGSFDLPEVGRDAGPSGLNIGAVKGFNSTAPYTTKARLYLGQRFGASLFAYVPMLLTMCFLLADALIFFVAEATVEDRREADAGVWGSRLTFFRESLAIKATNETIRRARFGIGFVGVLISTLLYLFMVALPWQQMPFLSLQTKMPRPICEADTTDHKFGPIKIDYVSTKGGWKKDVESTLYELVVVYTMLFVLLILPFSTSNWCSCCNRVFSFGRGKTQDSATQKSVKDVFKKEAGRPDSRLRFVLKTGFPCLVFIPTVLILAGQAISGAAFGYAWAAGVVGIETVTDETTGVTSPAFNPTVLVDQIYDQTMATLSVTLVLGLIVGAILARYLIKGVSAKAATVFVVWVVVSLLFLTPLLYYAGVHDIFSPGKSNEHCKTFPSNYKFSKEACKVRFWTFLICLCLILLLLVGLILYGLQKNFPRFFVVPAFVSVRIGGRVPQLNGPIGDSSNPLNTVGGTGTGNSLGYDISGYRSAQQPFFNFKTNIAQPEEERKALLRPASVSFAFP